jgi:hypothetical protein
MNRQGPIDVLFVAERSGHLARDGKHAFFICLPEFTGAAPDLGTGSYERTTGFRMTEVSGPQIARKQKTDALPRRKSRNALYPTSEVSAAAATNASASNASFDWK